MTASDPAVSAAERAFDADLGIRRPFSAVPDDNFVKKVTVDAAREALAPLRELHHSNPRCECQDRTDNPPCEYVECNGCGGNWPCETAVLIYSTEELS